MDNNDLKETLLECRKREQNRAVLLSDIIDKIDYENLDDLGRDINRYLHDTEKDMIYTKLLHFYEQETEDELKEDLKKALYGTSDYFPAQLYTKDNMYVFMLPPMISVKRDKKYKTNGKYIKYLTMSLIDDADISIHTLKKPVVLFEHHICTDDNDNVAYVSDADNIDSKSCLDALQKFLFDDDNLLAITTIHRGVKDDKSFTKVVVMNEPIFKKNMQKGIIF